MVDVKIRELELDDVPRMAKIYETITGEKIEEETMSVKIEHGQSLTALGAEINGELAGFIIGESEQGVFGEEETIGWINMVGLDPQYRNQGIGRKLGEELINRFHGLGIRIIRTIVEDEDYNLLSYFKSLGLTKVPWTVLELKG